MINLDGLMEKVTLVISVEKKVVQPLQKDVAIFILNNLVCMECFFGCLNFCLSLAVAIWSYQSFIFVFVVVETFHFHAVFSFCLILVFLWSLLYEFSFFLISPQLLHAMLCIRKTLPISLLNKFGKSDFCWLPLYPSWELATCL